MAYDTHGNFAYGTVVTAPSPATTGTTIVIGTENFANFPDPGTSSSYQFTVWPTGTFPLSGNAEIGSVVGKATIGTLYLSRSAQGTRSVGIGDQFAVNITKKVLTDVEQYAPQDGWITTGETWTYAASDAPTFTVTVPGTLTSKYNSGMRVKLTSGGSVQYYLMSADPTVASGSSTLTIYGGTAYVLGTGAITNNFYSFHKSPQGFPLNPTYWSSSVTNTTDLSQASPTDGVWYNLGTTTISFPIGNWNVYYSVNAVSYAGSAGEYSVYCTLSTTGTSESNTNLTSWMTSNYNVTATTVAQYAGFNLSRTGDVAVASKTLYYLNTKKSGIAVGAIYNRNNFVPLIIRIKSNFL